MLLKAIEKKSTIVNLWAIGRMELAGSKENVTTSEDIDSYGGYVRIYSLARSGTWETTMNEGIATEWEVSDQEQLGSYYRRGAS